MGGIGREFIELTKYVNLSPAPQQLGLPNPPIEREPDGTGKAIEFPDHSGCAPEFAKLVKHRESVRDFAPGTLSLEQLSFLLWATQGIRENVQGRATLRTVPSAGARHPFETFVFANAVTGLNPGFYWYQATKHQIKEYPVGPDPLKQLIIACLAQEFIADAQATFVWTAIVARTAWRYGQRGFRYLYLDAGHVCQNLYLAAESLRYGVCAIAAFDDDRMNALLRLDGDTQFAIYAATVGKKKL
jgi:SagB-type dehydrogenase family enzyme